MDTNISKTNLPPEHYYGDITRKLFLVAGLIMLIMYPVFSSMIELPFYASMFATVIVAFLAGLQNPRQRIITIFNTVVAVLGCLMFEYEAVKFYLETAPATSYDWLFFIINQGLALIFFFAIYYSSKTLRGALLKEKIF